MMKRPVGEKERCEMEEMISEKNDLEEGSSASSKAAVVHGG